MKWNRDYQSSDVEDNRGRAYGGGAGGSGLLGPLLGVGARFGLPGVVLVLGAYFVLPQLFGGGGSQSLSSDQAKGAAKAGDDERVHFVSFVFDDIQNSWAERFDAANPYRKAKLVLFTDRTPSACGVSSAAVGPFYCPPDQKVYIDLSFYDELSRRFGAPGDFAQAYVIAHEVGHHVQNLLGIEAKVRSQGGPREGESGSSVKLELQADCFAGIWAHSTARRDLLEAGDIDEGLAAASAVGDDRLQKSAGGTVQPETWTHGSARERWTWFRRGYESGKLEACDTFAAP